MRYGQIVALVSIAVTATFANAEPQPANTQQFERAAIAWDEGRYPEALSAFETILAGRDAASFLRPIALMTGELFRTVELAADGTRPSWGGDGRHALFERGGDDNATISVVDVRGSQMRVVAEVAGRNGVVTADGRTLVYLRTPSSRSLADTLAALRAIQPNGFAEMRALRQTMARITAEHSVIVFRELEGGGETVRPYEGYGKGELAVDQTGRVYFIGNMVGQSDTEIFLAGTDGSTQRVTFSGGPKSNLRVVRGGNTLLYDIGNGQVGVHDLRRNQSSVLEGESAAVSRNGQVLALLRETEDARAIVTVNLGDAGSERIAATSSNGLANPALSPDGSMLVYQEMWRENWELMIVPSAGGDPTRLTHEVQHDLYPRFLNDSTVFAVMGEGRHRRSYLYDVATAERTRFFHNNTIRTVSPEYEWSVSPDGSKVLIVAERDGDTISPERAVYVVNIEEWVTVANVRDRVQAMLASEGDLRRRGEQMFASLRQPIQAAVDRVSTSRIYNYEADLFAFGSKFITEPGNAKAIAYLAERLRSFGYEVELQTFEPRGVRSANVIATLPGTMDPDLTYVVSSHFDSVQRGPGADDNTSGTSALLEAARVMRTVPQPTTIKFALFTGEEAGLLGSREFVRRAVADGTKIIGALNNDMVGFANDNRLDNTIRYSNVGIRDLQHAAAFLFTDLITYDAKYYKSTDAHAYYDAYGDIVGGIGSYPILGNPHYHQTHDVLETINHQLVAEVSKTTGASLMLMASSPSRINDLIVEHNGTNTTIRWTPSVESNVVEYEVAYQANAAAEPTLTKTREARLVLRARLEPGSTVMVRAVNTTGLTGWDWARAIVQ